MEYTDTTKIAGIFLFVDFEKAFDMLEWSFISRTLEVELISKTTLKNDLLFFTTAYKALSWTADIWPTISKYQEQSGKDVRLLVHSGVVSS